MIIETDSIGTFRFNNDLDYEVWKAKGKQSRVKIIEDHNFGEKLYCKTTRNTYDIEKVYAEWNLGWAIYFNIKRNDSRLTIAWKNINSFSHYILKEIKLNNENMELI